MPAPNPRDDRARVLDAMRSGEWLRTQWIARVAFGLGGAPWRPEFGARALRILRLLENAQMVERRSSAESRRGEIAGIPVQFEIPRSEWRRRSDHGI